MAKIYENVFQYGQWGKDICIREYDTKTKKVRFRKNITTSDHIPVLYSPDYFDGSVLGTKKTFETNQPLFEKHFSKMSELKKIINPEKMSDDEKELKALQDNKTISEEQEAELKALQKERKDANEDAQEPYYGNPTRVQQVIRDLYPNAITLDHDFHTIYIDIETRSGVVYKGFPDAKDAFEEITVIQMYCSKRKEFFIMGTKPWGGKYTSRFGKVNYEFCPNEEELLNDFVNFIEEDHPAIMFGFNSQAFDFPYLVNRINNVYPDIEPDRLSPVNEIQYDVKMKTFDDREFLGCKINGIFLADQRDLVLKYAFLTLANFGLNDVAGAYDLKGKSSQISYDYQSFDGSYTGNGWVKYINDIDDVPEDEKRVYKLQHLKQRCMNECPEKWTEQLQLLLEQAVYDNFMDYSIRDVELMLEIEEQSKLVGIAKTIAYTSGVNFNEVMGTYKQWVSALFNQAFKEDRILPLVQKNGDSEAVYKAGFVASFPGIYKYVISVDFASLFPNIFQAFNIGADTIIPEEDLHEDLLEIREKFYTFFTNENFYDTSIRKTESDEHHEARIVGKTDGKFIAKYGSDGCNNLQEERDWYFTLLQQDFSEVLQKHNVSVTPNGYFYSNARQSDMSHAMEEGIARRYSHKYKGIDLFGELQEMEKELQLREDGKIDDFIDLDTSSLKKLASDTRRSMDYEDSLSLAYKININSAYGASALGMAVFSNGRLTGASVTISARLLIQAVAMALSDEIRRFIGKEASLDLSEIVQMDTDSCYLCLDNLINAKLPNKTELEIMNFIQVLFKTKLAPTIQKTIDDISHKFNLKKPEVLKMDQEIVSNSFVSLALKRYFARLIMSDGKVLAKPKIKMTGISLVSRSTPDAIKGILKPTLDFFLDNDKKGLNEYLTSHYEGFTDIEPSKLSRPIGVSSVDYEPYFDKRKVSSWKIANKFAKIMRDKKKSMEFKREIKKVQTAPLNSKGSIVHNHLIEEAGLEGKFELIRNADKIRIVYLKVPNPITHNIDAIAYKDPKVLKELGVEKYFDYSTAWEKELIKKVDVIAEKIDWSIGVRTANTQRADSLW